MSQELNLSGSRETVEQNSNFASCRFVQVANCVLLILSSVCLFVSLFVFSKEKNTNMLGSIYKNTNTGLFYKIVLGKVHQCFQKGEEHKHCEWYLQQQNLHWVWKL